MKIFQIQSDNPQQIPHLYFSDEQQMHFYTDLISIKAQNSKPISNQWQPTAILNLQTDIGKLTIANKTFWVITEKVKTAIEPLLKDRVEYLPLINRKNVHKIISRIKQITHKKIFQPIIASIHEEQQYLLHILDIKEEHDAIDFENSNLQYDIEEEHILEVNKLVFEKEAIQDSHIFKINNPGLYFQMATFVSEAFKDVVERNGFSGVDFERC